MSKEQLKTFKLWWHTQGNKTMTPGGKRLSGNQITHVLSGIEEVSYVSILNNIYPGVSTSMLSSMGILHSDCVT